MARAAVPRSGEIASPLSRYRVELFWSEEDQEFVAIAPRFGPGVSALARTPEETLREFELVLEAVEELYRDEGWDLPQEPTYSGQLRVRMPRSLHATLVGRAREEKVSLNTLIVSYLSGGVAHRGHE